MYRSIGTLTSLGYSHAVRHNCISNSLQDKTRTTVFTRTAQVGVSSGSSFKAQISLTNRIRLGQSLIYSLLILLKLHRKMKVVVVVALCLIAICLELAQGRPSEAERKDLEKELNGAIEINGDIYVKRENKETATADADKIKGQLEKKEIATAKHKATAEVKNADLADLDDKSTSETDEADMDAPNKETVVEGDIMLTPYIKALREGKGKRNILKSTGKWTNGKYYYQLDASLTSDMKKNVKDAIAIMGKVSCIEFIESKNSGGYVLFQKTKNLGCNSYIGKTGNQPQVINVAPWCKVSKLLHEILHSLGFLHEQSRPDRDDYITVNWKNIKAGMEGNFEKYDHPLVDTYKEPYDYKSILHYSKNAFSKNGEDTITPKGYFVFNLGNRDEMSDKDKKLLNKYYGCKPCVNEGWGCAVRKLIDSCERGKSSCLGSCGLYCKA